MSDEIVKSRAARKQAEAARLHRPSPEMDLMLVWKKTEPAKFDALTAAQKLSLGYYVITKQAAEAERRKS